ncbi:MAG: OmpA family protein [Alistipes sp.]
MRKLIFTLALVAVTMAAMAGETPKKPSCAGFVSNGFWDNWEISVGMGAGTILSSGKNYGDFGNRLGFEGNFSITKWIHPVAGFRVQLQGGRFANYDQLQGKVKWPYLFVHTDFMLNLSNWIGGYREDRAYYAVPFVGFGYMASCFSDSFHAKNNSYTRQEFAATFGLLNKFRISPSVDFNIELKSFITHSRVAPTTMSGARLYAFSATAGFTYRFNRHGWKRAEVAAYSAEDIRAFQQSVAAGNQALADAKAANAKLAQELADAKAAMAVQPKVTNTPPTNKEIYLLGTSVVFFDCAKTTLTDREKVRLDLVAEQIKAAPKGKVFTIDGHADYQTGTTKSNDRLAMGRAKTVYDYLVQAGVNPDQLKYEGMGDTHNPFKIPETNRAAVIQ